VERRKKLAFIGAGLPETGKHNYPVLQYYKYKSFIAFWHSLAICPGNPFSLSPKVLASFCLFPDLNLEFFFLESLPLPAAHIVRPTYARIVRPPARHSSPSPFTPMPAARMVRQTYAGSLRYAHTQHVRPTDACTHARQPFSSHIPVRSPCQYSPSSLCSNTHLPIRPNAYARTPVCPYACTPIRSYPRMPV
jgi:hypothetical protein